MANTMAWPIVAESPHPHPTPVSALKWSTCLTSAPVLPAAGGVRRGPLFQTVGRMLAPHDPGRRPAQPSAGLLPQIPIQPEPPPKLVGPLRNGNPRGNPNAAPRCGAKTRAGCPCKSPAMKNGRCRMHGGASTGPSAEGRARIAAARTIHGGRSAAMRAFGRQITATKRRGAVTIAMARAGLQVEDLAPLICQVRTESGRGLPKTEPPLPRRASKAERARCFTLRALMAMDFTAGEVGMLRGLIAGAAYKPMQREAMPTRTVGCGDRPGDSGCGYPEKIPPSRTDVHATWGDAEPPRFGPASASPRWDALAANPRAPLCRPNRAAGRRPPPDPTCGPHL